MKFILLINLKLLTTANSFLLNLSEHENFSANKYENANFIGRENFMLSWAEHEKSFITSEPEAKDRCFLNFQMSRGTSFYTRLQECMCAQCDLAPRL